MPQAKKTIDFSLAPVERQGGNLVARGFNFKAERVLDEEKRTVEMRFSSDAPAEQWFGTEVLSHEAGACDLTRLNAGAPLLWMHDLRDQRGIVESAKIEGKKGRCVVRFSKSAEGEKLFQDVKDGIVVNVSVGYRILDYIYEEDKEGNELFTVTKWEPYEVSFVSAPADFSVGVGRSVKPAIPQAPVPTTDADKPNTNERNITTMPATPKVTSPEDMQKIGDLARAHKAEDLAMDVIRSGGDLAEFQGKLLERAGAKPVTVASVDTGLTPDRIRAWSLVEAVREIVDGKPGIYAKETLETAKRYEHAGLSGAQVGARTILIPSEVVRSKNLITGTRGNNAQVAQDGAVLVAENVGPVTPLARPNSVLMRNGAQVLTGLVGNINIPKKNGGTTAFILAPGESAPEGKLAFGRGLLQPRRVAIKANLDKQLFVQSTPSIEQLIREDINEVIDLKLDALGLFGAGGKEPIGILTADGVGEVTFGAAPTWAKVVEFETKTTAANLNSATARYLLPAAVLGAWKSTPKVDGAAVFLADGGLANGYNYDIANQIADGKVIFGDISQCVFAFWSALQIEVDPFTRMGEGEIILHASVWMDFMVRQPGAFSRSTDSGAQ